MDGIIVHMMLAIAHSQVQGCVSILVFGAYTNLLCRRLLSTEEQFMVTFMCKAVFPSSLVILRQTLLCDKRIALCKVLPFRYAHTLKWCGTNSANKFLIKSSNRL